MKILPRLAAGILGIAAAAGAADAEPAAEPAAEWPYSRPVAADPPAVKDTKWVRNGIDAFVLAALERHGLAPAPEAPRRELARRLFLDLIGLPPAPEEVEAFVNDPDPRAYEALVDRLLADPRYGERWARLWLDLARYADTAGYEGDPDLPHSWRYRDYVIDAFNGDKPYDRFIEEQIAGDEFAEIMGAGDLPEVEPERAVALTFLRLAPFTEPRGDETRHEMLSEMTSTIGSVFLGLTVGCARCHDHKYDAIPTRDFYRMKAFLSTIQIPHPEPGDIYQIGGPLPANFYRPGEEEWAAGLRARYEREIEESKRELGELTAELEKRLGGAAGFGMQFFGRGVNNYYFDHRPVSDGAPHLVIADSDSRSWRFFTDGGRPGKTGSLSGGNAGDWFGDIPHPEHVSLGMHTAGTGRPSGAPHRGCFAEVLIYDHPLDDAERSALAAYVDARNRGKAPSLPEPPRAGLRFRLDAADLDADPATPNPEAGAPVAAWTDKVAGIRLEQKDIDLQPRLAALGEAGAPAVLFDGDLLIGRAGAAAFLGDQQGAIAAVFTATHTGEGYGFEVGGGGAFLSTVIHPGAARGPKLEAVINDPGNPLITAAERERHRYLASRERFNRQHLKRLRPVAMSLRHSYGPPYEPGVPTSRVMVRGEFDNPGEVIEAGFPSAITGSQEPAKIRLDPFKRWPTRSRRMALARWIAGPDNPLTARVLVNRLWHWHFGRGIVATPSDFGKLSGGPSHPELLDWLALRFVEAKWSIKAMHRLLVTSSAYRQTSRRADARAETIDPDNTLLWRFNRRRLEAEAIRDGVLAVSGRLNPERYGLPIFPPLPADIAETVKWDDSKWDTQRGPEGRRRSIYIYQQRTLTMPFMQTFDALVCDESRPLRVSSVTPLQALAMANGEFVNEEAKHFAERVRREAGADRGRQIERAFLLAFARRPSDEEAARMRALLESETATDDAPTGLCRILLNANEFIYID